MKDRNTVFKLIFIASIALTALTIVTGGIANGANNTLAAILVLVLIMLFRSNGILGTSEFTWKWFYSKIEKIFKKKPKTLQEVE